ncbi:MAG: DegT/DnrJ/EryC1/StrS family aminotransferase [Acidobacteria bacterium]|nr:DegT/DnrJ/EryC1/StrS family aminotransferase [Acidobacteriota bacterium]
MSDQLALLGGPKAIREPLPTFLEYAGRTFGREEEELVLRALRSGCLSRNGGVMVAALEREFAARLGAARAVACSSGTAAVHLAVAALNPEPGDEFIVPPITDMGTILPVLWQNCVPVFADVDPETLTIDPDDVERNITDRTRAIIAVHLAGQPCQMAQLRTLADRYHITLIEDCAQAYWAKCDGKLVGTLGDAACFSLQQSKHITCGEGGLMVTSRPELADRAGLFADKAWPRDSKDLGGARFLFLAQNYRMSELQGAVALAQLPKVAEVAQRRRQRALLLTEMLANVPGVRPPTVPVNTDPSYWLYMLHIDEGAAAVSTAQFGEALLAEGVPAWVQYIVKPLYLASLITELRTYGNSQYPFHPYGRQEYKAGLCPQAERALNHVIAIHWNENYSESQVEQIRTAIVKVARHFASSATARRPAK